jgi:BirA family biotin operon repressor/biotin-[acetyl-CoA-carboxylase] ligase
MVALGAGVAVSRAFKSFGYDTCLKWPNDIIFQGKKLGGIIGERVGGFTLLGIGVNLKNEIPREIENEAISIPQVDRDALLLSILEHLEDSIEKAIPLWRKFQCTLGRMVEVDGKIGVAKDIDEEGFLLLETEGKVERIATGTLRFLENL